MKVQQQMCDTCIYRPTAPLDVKMLEAEVADDYGGFRTFRACHHATRKICCRGFWDRHKNKFALGQIAQRLNFVTFVNIDKLRGPTKKKSNSS